MKKRIVLAITAVLILVLCIVASGESSETGEIQADEKTALVGFWTFAGLVEDEQIFSYEGLDDAFMLGLEEDGTAIITISGVEKTGTWSLADRFLNMQNVTYPFRHEDGYILVDLEENFTVALAKSEVSADEIHAKADAARTALLGTWRLHHIVTLDGEKIDLADLEDDDYGMTVTFTDDGFFTSSTFSFDLSTPRSTHTYSFQVANTHQVLLDGDYAIPLELLDGMIALCIREGWYYFLPYNEPDIDAAPADEALIGLWRIISYADADGSNEMNRQLMDVIGFDETLEFTADGRSIMVLYAHGEITETSTHHYEIGSSGNIVVDGSYVEHYVIEGDTLIITEKSSRMQFVRIPDDSEASDFTDVNEATPDQLLPEKDSVEPGPSETSTEEP